MDEKEFALRLAKLREQRGISARDMSLSMGQNPGYINNIETGKAKPSLTGFFYICDFLGVTPAEFFDAQTDHPIHLRELTQELRRLNDRQLQLLSALVTELMKT